jgi:hypothetical protein
MPVKPMTKEGWLTSTVVVVQDKWQLFVTDQGKGIKEEGPAKNF